MTLYERHGDHLRCPRHGVDFDLTGSCERCDADPGPAPELRDDYQPPTPEGCLSSAQLEQTLTAELEAIRVAARELVKPPAPARRLVRRGKAKNRKPPRIDRRMYSTAAKLWDTWLKGVRALNQLVQYREDAAIVRRRERIDAERRFGVAN